VVTVTARLLLAALVFALAALSLLAHRRVGYAVACLAGAWFAGLLFAASRHDRVENWDAQTEQWVAGIGCGCGCDGPCEDCDLRLDDR
jgi:hypothetical protein